MDTEEIRKALVGLTAVLPSCLPQTADRRKMWERIPSVIAASAGSEETWGKFIEAIVQRLQIDRAQLIAREEAANTISIGSAWDPDTLSEALRQLSEESTLIAALARIEWEQRKERANVKP